MTTFMPHFNARFPIKTCHLLDNKKVTWLTKGLIVSRNRMQILHEIKRSTYTPVEVLHYINKYKLIYKNLVKEEEEEKEKVIGLFHPLKMKLREYGR